MSLSIDPKPRTRPLPAGLAITLLDLVAGLWPEVRSEEEIVERVYALLESGRIRLVGNFRGVHLEGRH